MLRRIITLLAMPVAGAFAAVDFAKEIQPILELNCVKCHGAEQQKGGFRLDTRQSALKAESDWIGLVPGHPDKSAIYKSLLLPLDDESVMPPKKEARLTKAQIELVGKWISEGAKWPDTLTIKAVRRIDFVKDVQPILEFNCVGCHREGYDKGSLRLDDRALAFKGGESGKPGVVAGNAAGSTVHTSMAVPVDNELLMPPKAKNGPLPKDQIETLRDWINQGAYWPDGLALKARKKEEAAPDEDKIVAIIYQVIQRDHKPIAEDAMKAYEQKIPGTLLAFEMLPIKGGKFSMGSPENEKGRAASEGPVHAVQLSPFWMGKHEVTWDEYHKFMYYEKKQGLTAASDEFFLDAVTTPTKPYVNMDFGMGTGRHPAISMTHHAANKYCQWLSAKTGQFYRLPTEAEWEYACRAGTTTAYSWGDDPAKMDDYAWHRNNTFDSITFEDRYRKVGVKKPNPWGLHDIHGNVAEWCLDQFAPYQATRGMVIDPWVKATKPYPHVARGGSFHRSIALDHLRSASRLESKPDWKMQDPQLPKSIWYLTDAQFIGLRVVRPLKLPTEAAMKAYWNSGTEKDNP